MLLFHSNHYQNMSSTEIKYADNKACQEALQYAIDTNCIISYERSFMQPIFNGITDKAKIE